MYISVGSCFSFNKFASANDSDWKKQLKEIQQNEMLRDKGYPQLVSYALQGEVKTVDEMKRLKKNFYRKLIIICQLSTKKMSV